MTKTYKDYLYFSVESFCNYNKVRVACTLKCLEHEVSPKNYIRTYIKCLQNCGCWYHYLFSVLATDDNGYEGCYSMQNRCSKSEISCSESYHKYFLLICSNKVSKL